MKTDLKSCPFCEGEARLRPWNPPGRSETDPFWVVTCEDCGAMTWPYSGKADAIKRWNLRRGTAEREEPRRRCISCRYSRSVFGKLFCMGVPDTLEVKASDFCDAWTPEDGE